MKKSYEPTPEDLAWRKGYDFGVQQTLRDHDDLIKIGKALMEVFDKRYELKKEDE